jgi:hypothetical protein
MKQRTCPGCGQRRKHGKSALLLAGREVRKAIVCPRCASHAVLLVVAERSAGELAAAASLVPFVRYLHKLARAYAFDDESRAEGLRQAADILEHGHPPPDDDEVNESRAIAARVERVSEPQPTNGKRTSPVSVTSAPASDATLDQCACSILAVLSSAEGRTWSRRAVAIEAQYSVTSGSFGGSLAALRMRGFIDGAPRALHATDRGRGYAKREGLQPPPRGASLAEYWSEKVGYYAGSLLQILASPAAPQTRDELAQRAGYSVTSGSFGSALSTLRRLGLVDGLKASREFLEAIAPPNEQGQ